MKFQSYKLFSNCLCGTKCKIRKKTERNGKIYCLNGLLRTKFLDSKVKTRGNALNNCSTNNCSTNTCSLIQGQ